MTKKTCTKCENTKILDCFNNNKTRKDGLCDWCKQCYSQYRQEHREERSEYNKKYYKENVTERKQYSKDHYWKNKDRYIDARFRRVYGITLEECNTLLEQQNYRCVICQCKADNLVVDHCHTKEKVRGLLCGQCNSAIGLLKESEDNLLRAIEYLRRI